MRRSHWLFSMSNGSKSSSKCACSAAIWMSSCWLLKEFPSLVEIKKGNRRTNSSADDTWKANLPWNICDKPSSYKKKNTWIAFFVSSIITSSNSVVYNALSNDFTFAIRNLIHRCRTEFTCSARICLEILRTTTAGSSFNRSKSELLATLYSCASSSCSSWARISAIFGVYSLQSLQRVGRAFMAAIRI